MEPSVSELVLRLEIELARTRLQLTFSQNEIQRLKNLIHGLGLQESLTKKEPGTDA